MKVKNEMKHLNYELKVLDWDTSYFGLKSAKVVLDGPVEDKNWEKLLTQIEDFEFISITNLNNEKENNIWLGQNTDSFLSDINVQFEKKLGGDVKFVNEECYISNFFEVNKTILEISGRTFKYSRFFNDPYLSKNKAKSIYQMWTKNAFEREDKYFVVSKKDKINGFLLFSIDNYTATIELIAVDDKYQGQGIGKKLILALEGYLKDKDVKKIKVGTQLNNIYGINFYNSIGFNYNSCSSVYHFHKIKGDNL